MLGGQSRDRLAAAQRLGVLLPGAKVVYTDEHSARGAILIECGYGARREQVLVRLCGGDAGDAGHVMWVSMKRVSCDEASAKGGIPMDSDGFHHPESAEKVA